MRNLALRWLLSGFIVAVQVAGCGSAASVNDMSPSDGGAVGDAAADQAPPGVVTVTGTRTKTHIAESGKLTERAVDLSSATLEALVPDGTGSGFTVLAGTGKSDGTFSIPGVSLSAPYYLHYYNAADFTAHQYFLTSAASVDLGEYSGQRSGVVTGASGTALAWDSVGALDAWGATDQLLYYSSEVGLYLVGASPAAGSVALNLTQSFANQPLLSSAQADKLYVLQLHESALSGTETFQAASRVLELPALDLSSATSTTVSGTSASFSAPPMRTASFELRRSQFAALNGDLGTIGSVTLGHALYVSAILGGESLAYGFYTNSADLLSYASSASSDVTLTKLSFGNPFSSSYGLIGDARTNFTLSYKVPGATVGLNVTATVSRAEALASFTSGPIVPNLGPVQGLQINGQSAYSIATPVGTQPVLSWSAPALGTASGYLVGIQRLYLREGTTRTVQAQVAQIQTESTRLVVPPGLLKSGEQYVFRVTSFARPNYAVSRPYRLSCPTSSAATLTAMVTP